MPRPIPSNWKCGSCGKRLVKLKGFSRHAYFEDGVLCKSIRKTDTIRNIDSKRLSYGEFVN